MYEKLSKYQTVKNKVYILAIFILLVVLFIAPVVPRAWADSTKSKEQQIKAAFLYNFIKFVDWPEEKMADSNEPIIIGIIGSKDFVKAVEPLIRKKIKNRNISIKYFEDYEKLKRTQDDDDRQWNQKMESLKTCHVLMFCICDSVRIKDLSQIIKALKGSPVLTVGETAGFLEFGGIINFLMEDKKVRFEINVTAAKKNKLTISSKLLRLAKRVVKEKTPQQEKG